MSDSELFQDASTLVRGDYQGSFEGVSDGRAEGWAYDRSDPQRRLQIEIRTQGRTIISGEASLHRDDLELAGFGDGRCRFSISLPSSLADGREHVLVARISGSGHTLDGVQVFQGSAAEISGVVDELDGLTLRGRYSSSALEWRFADLIVDGGKTTEIPIAPMTSNESFAAEVPLAFADGNIHWFQARLRGSGLLIAEAVFILPIMSTPEDALQRYARDFPGHMSSAAANRYASLEGQLSVAPRLLERQERSGRPITLDEHLVQLQAAHRQVRTGIKEQNRHPERIRFPVYGSPDVSIVIPAHNKFWVTYNCLAALCLAPNKASTEIILVDDGSSDQTSILEQYVTGITICRSEVAQGFVKGSNLGAASARGRYVVMLNNDTEPCACWVDELLYVFDHFSDVGLVGAKFVYPNGKLQEAGGIVFPNLDVWNYGRNGNPADPRYNYTRQVDYVSGACIMLRKGVWDELGGFDEHFAPAYYEDNDLAFRVRAKGLKTYYTPFSKIIHFEGVSSGTSLTSGVKRFQAINEPKFRARWAPTIRAYPSTLDPHLAKDRGTPLRALVIDVQVPQPDKDAGSYAAIQEMRLLQALGFKLTFVPTNLAYLGNYTEALQRTGIECLYAPFTTSVESLIEGRGQEFDVFYITRYSVAERYIDLIRQAAPRAKIVFNNADLHFLREIRAAIAAKNPAALASAVQTRDLELGVMRRTDVTLSYTETEAAVIASHNLDATRVARCPWVLETEATVPPFKDRKGLAFLGNYQHPPNEEAVRYFVLEIMPELRRRVPDITFHIYGSHMPDSIYSLADTDVLVEGYVENVSDVYHSCRIFVAPLLSGAGIKGKVLGALAAGTPTVMTSLAAEGITVGRGTEALVADSPSEWTDAIAGLYANEKRWADISKRAQQFTRAHFSFEKGLNGMKDALALAGVYVG